MKNKCDYCGLIHSQVEAGGMYFCPNPICSGPGAHWSRASLESYTEDEQGHEVDNVEYLFEGLKKAYLTDDPVIIRSSIRCAKVLMNEWEKENDSRLKR